MTWFNLRFNLFFPLVMLVAPIGFVLCMRRTADSVSQESLDRARRLTIALFLATAVCVGIHIWLWAMAVRLNWLMFAFFFPLWFGLAMPAIAARNPDLVHAHAQSTPVRRASLRPRDHAPLASKGLWFLAAAVSGVLLVGIALRPWGDAIAASLGIQGVAALDDSSRSAWQRWLVIDACVVCFNFVLLVMGIGMLRREPEPMDARESKELAEAYASLRRFKAAAFLWLFGIGMNAMFGAALLALAWLPADSRSVTRVLATGGSLAGTLLGVAGAVLGTMASLRRARITRLIRALDSQAAHVQGRTSSP